MTCNRIQILNWRQYGDDESYCRSEVFGAVDDCCVCTLQKNARNKAKRQHKKGDS